MAQKNFADAMNQIVNGTDGLKTQINAKADKNSPALTGTPTAPTPDNDCDSGQIATTEFCQNLIRRLVGSAPETLNTLVELATAINNDPTFAQTIVQALDGKLNKTDAANTYISFSSQITDVSAIVPRANQALALTTKGTVISLLKVDADGKYKRDGDIYLCFGASYLGDGFSYESSHHNMEWRAGDCFIKMDNENHQIEIQPYERLINAQWAPPYYFKSDGIYLGGTKITN